MTTSTVFQPCASRRVHPLVEVWVLKEFENSSLACGVLCTWKCFHCPSCSSEILLGSIVWRGVAVH